MGSQVNQEQEGSRIVPDIQQQVVNTMLVVIFYSAIPLVALSLLRMVQTGWLHVMGLHLFILLMMGSVYWKRYSLSLAPKASVIIILFIMVGTGTIFQNHDVIYGSPYYLTAVMLTMLFFSLRSSVLVMLLLTAMQGSYLWYSASSFEVHAVLVLIAAPVLGMVVIYTMGSMKRSLAQSVELLDKQNHYLEHANREAQSANKAKSDFLTIMSHELRTPMSGVLGATELLMNSNVNEQQQKYVSIIQKSGRTLLSLVNNVLDFSYIEAGKLELELQAVDIRQLLQEVYELLKIGASDVGLQLVVKVGSDVPQTVMADEVRIKQILHNLINNAIKYTQQGEVVVAVNLLKQEHGQAELNFTVTDSGAGINPEKIDLLFQDFMQLDTSLTRKHGGAGLGLAINKRLVELMGGEIGVKNNLGTGAQFWFVVTLSVVDGGPQQNMSSEPQLEVLPKFSNAKDYRLLLAEDNQVNQVITLGVLNKMGFKQVDLAENGRMAVHYAALNKYDLVLMDLLMPEMDGLSATRRIRTSGICAKNSKVPIIALTANAMKQDRQLCFDSGMNDFVSKPVDSKLLVEKLARWIPSLSVSDKSKSDVIDVVKNEDSDNSEEPKMFDRTILEAQFSDNEGLIERVLITFLDNCDQQIESITQAIEAKDCLQLHRACHSFKGSSSSIGATEFAQLLMKMEQFAGQEQFEQAVELYGQLYNQFNLLVEELRKEVKSEVN